MTEPAGDWPTDDEGEGPDYTGLYGDDEEQLEEALTVGAEEDLALVERFRTDPRVKAAAMIGHRFGLDPITVLAETDRLRKLLRLASARIVQDEEKRSADREAAEYERARRRGH
jgi:hypothetical protein